MNAERFEKDLKYIDQLREAPSIEEVNKDIEKRKVKESKKLNNINEYL